ncbi:MAG: hypothetical protein PHV11_09660 [Candidatus Bipolaricaulis sp.]|nr:hypothetical protein [Candidatus Bipolaricaulis sp.]
MTIKPNSIIAVDLDRTLCKGESFTEMDCITAKPIQKTIDKVNQLNDKGCFIIVYTSRKGFLYDATEHWLRKHQVRYNVLVCGKVWADYYLDDKAINIKDI